MSKYKVVIVDDEYLIRELLDQRVKWEALGCEVVLKANSASEVFDYLDEHAVDIILTDINMPVIDGLAMSRKVRAQFPNIKIVIVTGYDEFDYAKQSIEIGVDNYILKPLDEKAIEESLRKVIGKIEHETNKAYEYEQLRQSVRENKSFMKEKFFLELIAQRMDISKLEERAHYFDVATTGHFYQIIAFELVPSTNKVYSEEERLMKMYQGRLMLSEIVEQNKDIHVFEDSKEHLVLLNSGTTQNIYDELSYYIKLVNQNLEWDVCVGVSRVKEQLVLSHEAYQEAVAALRYAMVIGYNQVIYYNDMGMVLAPSSNHEHIEEDFEQLEFYIKAGLKSEAIHHVENIFEKMSVHIQSNKQGDMGYIRIQTSRMLSVIYYLMYAADENMMVKESTKNRFDDINKIRSIPDAKSYIFSVLENMMDQVNGIQQDREEDFVREIERFISERIGNSELTLKSTAEHFFLNPSYLSRLYKQKLGISFKEHIIKQRMEKAVELLRTTDLKVYEISDQVGIVDPNYFSLCFKKYMNMSVSDYKRGITTK